MFWEIFLNLCAKVGKSPNAVGKEIGVSSGSITFWKQGKVPHHGTLIKIAEYFNVSVDELLGKEQQKNSPTAEGDETVKNLYEIIESLDPESRQKALDYLKYLSDSSRK